MSERFAELLKYTREQKGLSQKELAKMIDISDRQISLYERGLSAPRGATLQKLANALQTTPAFLTQSETLNGPIKKIGDFLQIAFNALDLEFDNCFYIQLNSVALEPWYYENELIIIDPMKTFSPITFSPPKFNVFLFKTKNSNEYHLRAILKVGNGKFNAYAPNPSFPVIEVNESEIEFLGKVVGSIEA